MGPGIAGIGLQFPGSRDDFGIESQSGPGPPPQNTCWANSLTSGASLADALFQLARSIIHSLNADARFLLSPSADTQAERNGLQESVFPFLRKLGRPFGVTFVPTDMRCDKKAIRFHVLFFYNCGYCIHLYLLRRFQPYNNKIL